MKIRYERVEYGEQSLPRLEAHDDSDESSWCGSIYPDGRIGYWVHGSANGSVHWQYVQLPEGTTEEEAKCALETILLFKPHKPTDRNSDDN